MIENHVCELLSKAHELDHTSFARHVLKVHTTLVACYLMLQIEVSCIQLPLIII